MKFIALIPLAICLMSCGKTPQGPMKETSSVEALESSDKVFTNLPLNGQVYHGEHLWSEGKWEHNKGLINDRWNTRFKNSRSVTPTFDEVHWMSQKELAKLSPAEKYDLLMGRYDWPLTTEIKALTEPKTLDWIGLTNGWALASLHHNEPLPKTMKNPDGLMIPFGSSDIKGLLEYFYSVRSGNRERVIGRKCFRGSATDWWIHCESNLNPGSFHLALANKVALRNQSFLVDPHTDASNASHPVLAFSSRVEEEKNSDFAAPSDMAKVFKLRTKVTYLDEGKTHSWNSMKGVLSSTSFSKEYSYLLYLNSRGEIIGGRWESAERPEFIWTASKETKFHNMEGLKGLIND